MISLLPKYSLSFKAFCMSVSLKAKDNKEMLRPTAL
jgi:hypothetical protein